ncbi:MAG TPA: DUF4038 domain-containing protein [Verrucomicrobiales bacterium]|nr:DUF4038 domain-containing protein [Verrucomicrobiales bacterium]
MKTFLTLVLLFCHFAPAPRVAAQAPPPPSGTFPTVADLPPQNAWPDLLLTAGGKRITTREQWFHDRRPELLAQFQHYMYGTLPPHPEKVSGKIEREDRAAFKGTATLREVTVIFGPPEFAPIHLMLVIPNKRLNPAPVILGMNYFGNQTLVRDPAVRLPANWMPERGEGVVNNRSTDASRGTWVDIWRIEYLIERGYALATFYNGDIDPDRPDERGIQTNFQKLNPQLDCGTIGAWAWGLQRAVDYLITDPDIDAKRIAVTGHSRLGKAALVAAAFDERIALALPHQAGTGGSGPSRTTLAPPDPNAPPGGKKPETVAQINDKFPHWFNARFKEFNSQPDRLPFDQHALVALCAPRPVLFSNGRADTWINPAGQFAVLRAAAPVYRLLGAGDFTETNLPPDGTLLDGMLGFFIRAGGHSLRAEDWKAFLDFADKHFGPPAKPRTVANPTASAVVEVARWEMHEFELHGPCSAANPFRDATLTGDFTAPSGKRLTLSGFHDGGDTWRLRFAPDEEGEWRYTLNGKGVEIAAGGSVKCTAPRSPGMIHIHPANPYSFARDDGSAFFPMGDTCYGLFDDSPITPALRESYLKTRRAQKFNFVRLTIGHSEARAAADPAYWAWGGTPQKPDLDRFNPAFFRNFDALLRQMQTAGMNAELILLNFYRRPFTNTKEWTVGRERLWLRYVVSRYAAFPNVFLWTIANEYETHPDGAYRLDFPADVEWAKDTARFIKSCDPYRHPVTVHPVISASRSGESPRAPFDPPWRIGEFFGAADAIDVLSQQTGSMDEGTKWDEALKCWTGDSSTLVASLTADRRYRKPVLNTESGYEYLRGDPTSKKQVHHTDKVRRSAWRIVCAGGYIAAGFHGTIGHSDVWNRIDPGSHYTFAVKDEGAAAQLASLHDFFNALPFWRMQPIPVRPDDTVVLAEPGKVYVAYLPKGGTTTLDLSAATAPLTARWFNPRIGTFKDKFPAPTGPSAKFEAPDTSDWALLLQ